MGPSAASILNQNCMLDGRKSFGNPNSLPFPKLELGVGCVQPFIYHSKSDIHTHFTLCLVSCADMTK